MDQIHQNNTKYDDLKSEILARYRICETHYRDWLEAAEDDYSFTLGEQWTENELQQLKNQNRPALTFNRIKGLLNIVSGYQRENSARIRVTPEGGEDKVFSEVMDKCVKFIDKIGSLNYKLGYVFDDGLICGKGYLEAIINYDRDPVRGDLIFKIVSPFKVFVDPECREYDLNDGAEYLFKVEKFTKRKLIEMFPHKKRIVEDFRTDNDDVSDNMSIVDIEGDKDNYGNNPNKVSVVRRDDLDDSYQFLPDAKFTLKEYWYKKYVDKYFVVDVETGEPRKFDTEEEAGSFIMSQLQGEQESSANVIKRKVCEMWVASMVCGQILQDVISPFEPLYSGFPIFQFIADWCPNSKKESLRIQGMTRPLKDPQKEKNKSKSQYLHIVNTQANSGWIGDDDALSEEGWQKLEQMGSTPGVVVRKRRGRDMTQIQGQFPGQGHLVREQQADEEFKQISNINPDLLGMQDKTSSGRAIALRIKQAVMALVRIFNNFKFTKECIGKFIMDMIPEIVDEKRIVKIVGAKYMAVTRNEQYPDGITEGVLYAFLQLVKDHRYDVEVTEADATSTIRYEIFEQLTELAKSGYPIPPSVMVDYMGIQNSEEVKKEIQQMVDQQNALQQQKKA
jgi:hypothetical protein